MMRRFFLFFVSSSSSNRSTYGIVTQQRFRFSTCHLPRRELGAIEEHDELQKNVLYKSKEVREPPSSATLKRFNSQKLRAISKVSDPGPDGHLPEQVKYLMDFGFSHDQIKDMVRRFPNLAYYSLGGKIRPFIEFLAGLGISRSSVIHINFKQPRLCGLSLSENIIPTMTYLESLGIDKSRWGKVIHNSPVLLGLSIQKIKATVEFFVEQGLCEAAIGKMLARFPPILNFNVEDKLRPTSDYFQSLGISPSVLIQKAPRLLVISIEAKVKPMINFFLDKGFTMDEVLIMISRFANFCVLSLADNIEPKWKFFLTMGYPNSQLVKFPQYFGYSLEGRIKPRLSRMVSCGASASLNKVLSSSDVMFEKLIERKLKKMDDLSNV